MNKAKECLPSESGLTLAVSWKITIPVTDIVFFKEIHSAASKNLLLGGSVFQQTFFAPFILHVVSRCFIKLWVWSQANNIFMNTYQSMFSYALSLATWSPCLCITTKLELEHFWGILSVGSESWNKSKHCWIKCTVANYRETDRGFIFLTFFSMISPICWLGKSEYLLHLMIFILLLRHAPSCDCNCC